MPPKQLAANLGLTSQWSDTSLPTDQDRQTGSHCYAQKQHANPTQESDSTAAIASASMFMPHFLTKWQNEDWELLAMWQVVTGHSQNLMSPEALWAKFQNAKSTPNLPRQLNIFCCKDRIQHWCVLAFACYFISGFKGLVFLTIIG